MKKRCLYFAFLATTAFLAFLAACGDGTPINLADSSEWRDIQNDLLDIVEENGRIKDCNTPHSGSLECPEYPDRTKPSSSSEEPPPPPISSSANIITPSSSSPGISSAVGASSSSIVRASSSSIVGASSSGGNTQSSSSVTATLTCTLGATTGTVGKPITPAPTVQCNGTSVTAIAWTPTNLTATNTGSVAVSAIPNTGLCAGKSISCGNVTISAAPSSSSSAPPSSSSQGGGGGPTIAIGTSDVEIPIGTSSITCTGGGNLICWSNPESTFKLDGTDCKAFQESGWGACGNGTCNNSKTMQVVVTERAIKCKGGW